MKIDVRHVAKLARIELGEDELRRLQEQISRVLDYIDQLRKLDVSNMDPFTHPGEFGNVVRPDQTRPSLPRDQAVGNAPERSADFFTVPRVLEE